MDINYHSFWYKATIPFKKAYFKCLLSFNSLVKVDERHRGVGKSTMLAERAIKKDMTIVVGTQTAYNHLKEINKNVKILRLAHNFSIEVRGMEKNHPNGVLIDESLEKDLIEFLLDNNYEIKGGFLQNYRGDKSEN